MKDKNSLLAGFHKHHIIPKHSGGQDIPENLVYLHPIDHAIFHRLRFMQTKHPGDAWAFNRIMSAEGEDKFSLRGYVRSNKTKEKLSKANMGKKHSAETKQKLSDKKIGNVNAKKKCKVNGIIFNSVGDAAKHFGINYSSLSLWLSGKRKPRLACAYVD